MSTEPLEQNIKSQGFLLTQIKRCGNIAIYERTNIDTGSKHYEVIRINKVKKLIDFDTRTYSETDFIEKYPSNEMFGKNGWYYKTLSQAEVQFNILKGE